MVFVLLLLRMAIYPVDNAIQRLNNWGLLSVLPSLRASCLPRVTSENARASCEAASGVSFAGLLAFDSRYPPRRELACWVSSCSKPLRITLFRQGEEGKCHGSKNCTKRVIFFHKGVVILPCTFLFEIT